MKKWILMLCALLLVTGCGRKPEAADNSIDLAIDKERRQVANTQPPAPQAAEEYRSPVDFDALRQANPHIQGWLDIPGTDISYPILLHDSDNSYYLTHGENGSPSAAGCIYMEDYNHADFADAAIVLYGHHLRSGAYFGNLQTTYETEEGFREHRDVYLYLPQRQIHFRVFAAVPYSRIHLLYTYNFENRFEYGAFLESVGQIRSLWAQQEPQDYPQAGQQLLILSTCLNADNTMRYLVIGAAEEISL